MLDQSDFARARRHMVETQIALRGIRSEPVLAAMREVPREDFVEEGFEEFAYEDSPLPIGEGQSISQPMIVALMIVALMIVALMIVALMIEAAEIGPGDRVLEVGAGSGYAAAVISRIAERVYAIERHASLGERERQRFERLGYDNIELAVGDGTLGWPEQQAFNAILVAAGSPDVPQALKRQLAIGRRLVIPVGVQDGGQSLLKVVRRSETSFEEECLGPVAFVPLIGEQGWADARSVLKDPAIPGI